MICLIAEFIFPPIGRNFLFAQGQLEVFSCLSFFDIYIRIIALILSQADFHILHSVAALAAAYGYAWLDIITNLDFHGWCLLYRILSGKRLCCGHQLVIICLSSLYCPIRILRFPALYCLNLSQCPVLFLSTPDFITGRT